MPGPLYRPGGYPAPLHRRAFGGWTVRPVGGLPPPVLEIPFNWIATPLNRKPTIAITKAQISLANGPTAYVSASDVQVRQYGVNTAQATLHSACDADPQNLATFLTTFEAVPRPRQPTLTFDLFDLRWATDANALTVLGVGLAQRVRITGAPAGTPLGALNFTVEGIRHTIGVEQRTVTWSTAALVGASSYLDTFTRNVSGGWGSPDFGPAYSTSDPALSVAAGVGRIANSAAGTTVTVQSPVLAADFDTTVTIVTPSAPTGSGNITLKVVGRLVGNTYVTAWLICSVGPVLTTALQEVVDGVSNLSLGPAPTGGAVAGDPVRVRLQAQDTTIRMRAWKLGTPEPSAWQVTRTVTALAAGTFQIVSVVDAGITNTPPFVSTFDDLTIQADTNTNPQGVAGPWFRRGSSARGGTDQRPF